MYIYTMRISTRMQYCWFPWIYCKRLAHNANRSVRRRDLSAKVYLLLLAIFSIARKLYIWRMHKYEHLHLHLHTYMCGSAFESTLYWVYVWTELADIYKHTNLQPRALMSTQQTPKKKTPTQPNWLLRRNNARTREHLNANSTILQHNLFFFGDQPNTPQVCGGVGLAHNNLLITCANAQNAGIRACGNNPIQLPFIE